MYSVTVRDHIMIAHSLKGPVFGPAQRLHGATYVVDLELKRSDLDPTASSLTSAGPATRSAHVLAELNYQNLDEVPALAGRNTTTEFLARLVFDAIVAAIRRGDLGPGATGIEQMRVTLQESHVASASYEGRVNGPSDVRSISLVVPGRLDQRTGGYIYDRRMAEGAARLPMACGRR